MFTEGHIGILPINDLVPHVYFHFVDARRDDENLWMIADRRFLSGLRSVDEDKRTRGSTGHDDFGRIRQLLFPRTEPSAGR